MEDKKHTPLPYISKQVAKGFAIDAKTGKYDSPVGFVYAPFEHERDKEFDSTIAECKANAEFIVRACNGFYKTEKAIEDFLESINHVCGIEKERKAFINTLKAIDAEEGSAVISTKMSKEYWAEYESRELPAKKKRVRGLTKSAIKQGIIPKQPCEVCGSKSSEVHHITYDSPYQIKWFCKTHHHEEHNKLKAEGK